MNTLYIVCGPAGCGKSTFIHNLCKNFMNDAAIVSRDEIRYNVLAEDDEYFSKEEEVYSRFCATIGSCLNYGDVFADATHLTPKSRRCLLRGIEKTKSLSDVNLNAIYFSTNFCKQNCYKRNAQRTGRAYVPNEVIRNMIRNYRPPTIDEGFSSIFTITENTDIDLLYRIIAGEII